MTDTKKVTRALTKLKHYARPVFIASVAEMPLADVERVLRRMDDAGTVEVYYDAGMRTGQTYYRLKKKA